MQNKGQVGSSVELMVSADFPFYICTIACGIYDAEQITDRAQHRELDMFLQIIICANTVIIGALSIIVCVVICNSNLFGLELELFIL